MAVLAINGFAQSFPLTFHGNGVFQSSRKLIALATDTAANPAPLGTKLANLVIYRNGAVLKDFRGMSVAALNADT